MSTILDVLRKAEGDGRGRRNRASIEPPRDPLGPKRPKRRLTLLLGGLAVLAAAFALGLTLSNREDTAADGEATQAAADAANDAAAPSAPDADEAAVASAPASAPRPGSAPVPAAGSGSAPPVAPAPGAAAPGAVAPPASARTAVARNAPSAPQVPPTRLEQRLEPSKPPRVRARRGDGADRADAIAARQERLQERRRERRDRLAAARGDSPRTMAARAERPGAAGAGPAPPPPPAQAAPPPEAPAAVAPAPPPPTSPEPPREMLASVTRQPPTGVPNVAINIVQWSASPERRFAFVTVDGGGMTQVREGDEISGLTVNRIYQEMIEFGHNGASFIMRAN